VRDMVDLSAHAFHVAHNDQRALTQECAVRCRAGLERELSVPKLLRSMAGLTTVPAICCEPR
jgi:hypothetical protein